MPQLPNFLIPFPLPPTPNKTQYEGKLNKMSLKSLSAYFDDFQLIKSILLLVRF